MQTLKIKDDVDLKSLEQFGYSYTDENKMFNKNSYTKCIPESCCIICISTIDRTIHYDNGSDAETYYDCRELLVEIFRLTKAGIVEEICYERNNAI